MSDFKPLRASGDDEDALGASDVEATASSGDEEPRSLRSRGSALCLLSRRRRAALACVCLGCVLSGMVVVTFKMSLWQGGIVPDERSHEQEVTQPTQGTGSNAAIDGHAASSRLELTVPEQMDATDFDENSTFSCAPASSEDEDIEAARSARDDAEIARELQLSDASGGRPLAWVPVAGQHHVVDDEGEEAIPEGSQIKGGIQACKEACDMSDACKSFTLCTFGVCFLKNKKLTGSEAVHHNDVCTSFFQTTDTYRPSNRALALPSSGAAFTFYVYRAQGPKSPGGDYPLANVNVASLGGAMWYLHDEVVKDCWFGGKAGQRRFGITRLRRFKISIRATQPLLNKGMNFGILSAFDNGESTGWERGWHYGTGWKYIFEWNRHGYYVGCNKLGDWPHDEEVFQRARRYPNAIWYSIPGPCPSMDYRHETKECKLNYPGGQCSYPDGRGNCTYHVEEAGEIDIDELVGITPKWRNREDFCRQGGFEGDGATAAWGRRLHFWDNIWDPNRNRWRVEKAAEMFNSKYPDMPRVEDLQPPRCDFTPRGYW